MLLSEFVSLLKGAKKLSGGELIALCPAHADHNPSLTFKQGDGKLLISCKAGCSPEEIVTALGITVADLFTETAKTTPPATIIATYDYEDEERQPLFQVVRYEPKSFRQRHRNGAGEWEWNLNGVRRVLYHLPDLLIATTVYVVEGEKDADTLWQWGQVATTSPGGAQSWRDEYAPSLYRKKVVIIPDRDEAGFGYAKSVARSLRGNAELSCIILPGDSVKDVTDWINQGGDVADLPSMEQDISVLFTESKLAYRHDDDRIVWDRPIGGQSIRFSAERLMMERTGVHAKVTISLDTPLSWSFHNIERREERSSFASNAHLLLPPDIKEKYSKDDMRQDLDQFCAGLWDFRMSQLAPEITPGDDVVTPLEFYLAPYLLKDGGTIIFAPPGRGKSYIALYWAVSIDAGLHTIWQTRQAKTLFINLERSRRSITRRLASINKALGLPTTRPILMLNARGRSLSDVAAACRKAIKDHDISFVVLDSISRAGVGDITENVSGNKIIDTLSSLCPSWLALAHTPRKDEAHIYGSIMMDAGADVCVQLSSQILDNGTLGIGLSVTKQNDTGHTGTEIIALEFDMASYGLTNIRKAKQFEFPEIEIHGKQSMEQAVVDFILEQESADATATQIAEATGLNRTNINHYLANSGSFVQTRKIKSSVFYGLASKYEPPLL